MSSNVLAMIGHLRKPETVRDEGHILHALAAIAAQGYLLAVWDEIPVVHAASDVMLAESLAPGGVTTALHEHLRAYAAGDERFFSATAYSLAVSGYMGQFQFDVALSPEDKWLGIFVDDYEFRGYLEGRQGAVCYAEFLRMLPVIYAQWHPLFMYDTEGGIVPETTRADALALAPQWVYAINLFGPELVERMERERVMSAPACRVTPLDEDGVMLVPNGGFAGVYGDHRQAVAAHLGLPYDPGYVAAHLARWRATERQP